MKSSLFLFVLLVFIVNINAQEKLINGRIIIDLEEADPNDIYITNTRTNISAITDATGSFSIRAQAGDSLLIRSYQYETRRFYLNENLMNKNFINIHLNLQTVVLEEARITKKLTGFLDKDAQYNPKKDQVAKLYKELGVNPDASKLRDSSNFKMWKDISPFHLNVERLVDVFTGDLRRRQNLYEFEGREAKIKAIHQYFGNTFFIEDLNIPKERIRDFIFYAYGSSEIPTYYNNNNYLSIMLTLSKLAPIYLSRLDPWYYKEKKLNLENFQK